MSCVGCLITHILGATYILCVVDLLRFEGSDTSVCWGRKGVGAPNRFDLIGLNYVGSDSITTIMKTCFCFVE